MRMVLIALAATTAVLPAHAAVIYQESGWQGPYDGDVVRHVGDFGFPDLAPGSYEIRVVFDRAVATSDRSTIMIRYVYNNICPDPDPRACGGSDGFYRFGFTTLSDREFVSAFELKPARVEGDRLYFADRFVEMLLIARPVDQSPSAFFTLTISDVAAVPEPASWAMMIGGFGLLGAAARRRPRTAVNGA
jgi:hypothetical protein